LPSGGAVVAVCACDCGGGLDVLVPELQDARSTALASNRPRRISIQL